MILQILLASILTLNLCHGVTVAPPVEDSHTEATNIETTKIGYDYSPGNVPNDAKHVQQPIENASRHLDTPANSWGYQPFIEYGNVSPHSQSITQIAFGKDAVEALQKSKEPQPNANILYLQSEVKPVDNQLPVQDQQNVYYLSQNGVNVANPQDGYVAQPSGINNHQHTQHGIGLEYQGPVLYYSQVPQLQQVPQQLQPVPQNDNLVYITPQPQQTQPHHDYGSPGYQYQPNAYLVTHIQPIQEDQHQDLYKNYQDIKTAEDTTQKPKNIVVENMKHKDENHKSKDEKKDKNNDAKEKNHDDKDKHHDKHEKDEHVLVESNTAKAIIEEYERHYIKRRKNVDVKVDGETGTGTTPSPYPSATTPLSITKPAPLSRQPIIVADLDENNLEFDDKTFSTTQSTIKTVKTSSSLYHATQPLIVTPRPLGTTFLAPITAGVQLQSVDNQNHNIPTKTKDGVIVEIQKSVPYYLGKFEFVQNDDKPTKNDEIKQNVDLGANLLKYSIERLPNPQAFFTEFNNSGGQGLNQLSYSTVVNHGVHNQNQDQGQESGQFDYKYQQVLVPQTSTTQQQPIGEVTKLEKVQQLQLNEHELPQPVDLDPQFVQHQSPQQQPQPQIQVRQVYLPQQQIVSVPVKTVADYVQKLPAYQQPQHIPPLVQSPPSQHHYNQQPVLLEPFPHVTKLIPQYLPLKHHQEVQKVPMKTYSYAPSYQPNHYHHHGFHNYQHNAHNHNHKKPKHLSSSSNYQNYNFGTNFFHNVKFNSDYIGMKPPKIPNLTQLQSAVASTTSTTSSQQPSLNGPPFKASQHLQTIHEYLPATQLTDQQVRKYRNPRHSFGTSSIRLEYGFMPPLIPSIEIDEFGKPIDKSEA